MKLQKNYTTPEQSKRLLELGLPADSADCYYMAIGLDAEKYGYSDFPYFMTTNYVDKEHVIAGINIPCWSVGRLIEILSILYGKPISWIEWCIEQPPIETILAEIESGVFQNLLDFSKLED